MLYFIAFIVPLLAIAASIYISLNYIKREEPVRLIKSPRKKIPILKYTNDRIEEVSDDSIQGLVDMALNRKQKVLKKIEKKPKFRSATVPKPSQKSIVQSDEEYSPAENVLFTEKDELFTSSASNSYPSPAVEKMDPGKRVELAKEIKLYSPFKSGLVINLDNSFAMKPTSTYAFQKYNHQYQNSFFTEKNLAVTVGIGSDKLNVRNK
jgi:hypothetical protein